MIRYYDAAHRRLVFVNQRADNHFWDEHWSRYASGKELEKRIKTSNGFVEKYTRQYLPRGGRILEGGCGIGHNIYTLQNAGFEAFGVDYARETIAKIKEVAPTLNVAVGNIEKLNFPDQFFDGYWSLGVIEHFFDGYERILPEMRRVIKKHGYLFLTVPSMSPLRKIKASRGRYEPVGRAEVIRDHFYQYALRDERIIRDFTANGFRLVRRKPIDGLKGFKDEVSLGRPLLQRIYDSRHFFGCLIKTIADASLSLVANHMSFFIFQKR